MSSSLIIPRKEGADASQSSRSGAVYSEHAFDLLDQSGAGRAPNGVCIRLQRLPDWQGRLDAFLRRNQARKFSYGEWDCCQMAAQAIEAMTGRVVESYAGRYRTWKQAAWLMRTETGHGNVRAIVKHVMQQYGSQERSPNFAQRGDLMIVWRERVHLVGVLDLDGKIAVLREGGMARVPRDRAVSSWSV